LKFGETLSQNGGEGLIHSASGASRVKFILREGGGVGERLADVFLFEVR